MSRESTIVPRSLAFVVVLVLSGCGGGSGGGGSKSTGTLAVTTFQPATILIGQTTFDASTPNQNGSVFSEGLSYPFGLGRGSLWIADGGNDRVLRLPSPRTSTAPDLVVGQPDFTTDGAHLTGAGLVFPARIVESGGKLVVSDFGAHRVLIWDQVPTTNGASANVVVGQTDFTSGTGGTTASKFANPQGIAVTGGRLIAVDVFNNRVLIWNAVPTSNGTAADVVLGQTDFVSNAHGDGAAEMYRPRDVWTDGTRLVVSDEQNHRILIWNTFPAMGQPADLVLGQPAFDMSVAGTSATSLRGPSGLDCDGTRLAVADYGNNRVLIWNSFPTMNGQPADVVLGQGDFNHGTVNDDDQDGVMDASPTARTLDAPADVRIDGGVLYVADANNHRVLGFVSP